PLQNGALALSSAGRQPPLAAMPPPSTTTGGAGHSAPALRADPSDQESDSESSAEIIWEDNSANLVDLRHLLVSTNDNGDGEDGEGEGRRGKLPMAMTQQIEELSFASDESDDDENEEMGGEEAADEDGMGGACATNLNGTSNSGNGKSTHNNAPSAASTSNGKSTFDALTPPTTASTRSHARKKRGQLLRSGEVPATISKLKRRRRGGSGRKRRSSGEGMAVVNLSNGGGGGASRKGGEGAAVKNTEGGATQGKAPASTQSQAEDINGELHRPTGGGGHSPVIRRQLSLGGGERPPQQSRQGGERGRERGRIQLPPLRRRGIREKENEGNRPSLSHGGGGKTEGGAPGDGRDLFREIELGLDAAAGKAGGHRETAPKSGGEGAGIGSGAKSPSTVAPAIDSAVGSGGEGRSGSFPAAMKQTGPPAVMQPSRPILATTAPSGAAGAMHNQQTGQPCDNLASGQQTHPTHAATPAQTNAFEYDFDDDEWNDADLAAIDLRVARTQSQHGATARSSLDSSTSLGQSPHCQSQLNPLRRSAPLPAAVLPHRSAPLPAAASNPAPLRRSASLPAPTAADNSRTGTADIQGGEFDDDDAAGWDLAAIDRSVARTQSRAVVPPAGPPAAAACNNHDAAARSGEAGDGPATGAARRGEFSDDDDDAFAAVDLSALDSEIVRQRRSMTQQQIGGALQHPVPPPPDAPIRNRPHESAAACMQEQQPNQPQPPTFLAFTRYVVQSVRDDANTYTKTLGVSLWRPEGSNEKARGGKHGEMDRLRTLCGALDGAHASHDSSNGEEVDGWLHLRGEWYHTDCRPGDVVHLCSLSGRYMTDPSALPVTLHSAPPPGSDPADDLVLVVHPDDLISPTLVSEAVKCARLAVLQSRLGSTGLSAPAAVVGTLRHALFERCLRERDASHPSGARFAREILREHAAALAGCGLVDRRAAFAAVVKVIPQIQKFLARYTDWDASKPKAQRRPASSGSGGAPTAPLEGVFPSGNTTLSLRGVYSTEEWAHVPELGLKGSVDATIVARTRDSRGVRDALMPVELKTGHNQTPQHGHLAQLSTYTVMLRARHGSARPGAVDGGDSRSAEGAERGSASSGVLLYLNHENCVAKHVAPSMGDIKTLVGQRNAVVCEVRRAERPRGIAIEYEGDGTGKANGTEGRAGKLVVREAPPSALPGLHPNAGACERCYKNRECMMYAAADGTLSNANAAAGHRHGKLLDHFTGHLTGPDRDYFRKWDRLVDLERHAGARDAASKAWLFESGEKEARDGGCISSLVLDAAALPSGAGGEPTAEASEKDIAVRFMRSSDAPHRTPLTNLSFEVGSWATISEDGASFVRRTAKKEGARGTVVRRRMHILRGVVAAIGEDSIAVTVQAKDVGRLRSGGGGSGTKFRLDKDEYGGTCGLLLQNLVNFFTLDIPSFSAESFGTPAAKTKSMTENTDYSARRRRMNSSIISLDPPPRFLDVSEASLFASDGFGADVPGCDAASLKRDFARLNSDQKGAVLKVLSAEDFALVQGLPGTGKTATIAYATRLLVSRGKRVLLTSYTHSAVDNLLCKLMDGGMVESSASNENASSPMIRIGRESACSAKVQTLLAQNVAVEAERRAAVGSASSSSIDQPSVDYLHKVITEAKVVGVSALTAPRSPLLAGQHFDVVIVDEAGQISQPAILGAIMAADSFVLVGDHMQLPPLVVSEVAEQAGYGISMLMHLAEGFPDAVAKLTMQYRMNESICHLSNMIAYKGLLKCGNDEVRHQKLEIDSKNFGRIGNDDRPWIERAINPDQPVVFLDTDGRGMSEADGNRTGAGGPTNDAEVSLVEKLAVSLSICGVKSSSVGVITPFRSQLRMLNENLVLRESKREGLEMCTIDRFQGRDKSVTIISLVRSNKEGKAGLLLQDFRRLNVAFSRAKKKMIIVGSYSTLHQGSQVLRPVLDSMRQRGWVQTLPAK
ncbi:hypothetical protein ACHAXT_011819, partial [Thalassiosira profunda]